ncbi:hypothetical protein VaNZ11_003078, partial [Volvox africanus]
AYCVCEVAGNARTVGGMLQETCGLDFHAPVEPLRLPKSITPVFTMGKDRLDEPLDLHNYSTWKLRFQLFCAELGYSRALLQAPIAEADVIISDKVKSVMAKNVKNHHLQTIVRAANVKTAWDALAATFASTCNTRKVALRQGAHKNGVCSWKRVAVERLAPGLSVRMAYHLRRDRAGGRESCAARRNVHGGWL